MAIENITKMTASAQTCSRCRKPLEAASNAINDQRSFCIAAYPAVINIHPIRRLAHEANVAAAAVGQIRPPPPMHGCF